jgi:hypothetical protein
MKRSIRSGLLACGLAAVMALGFAVPADAVTIAFSASCIAEGFATPDKAVVQAGTCEYVRARIRWWNNMGSISTTLAPGLSSGTSVAQAGTTWVTERASMATDAGGTQIFGYRVYFA